MNIQFRPATNNDTALIKDIVYAVLKEYGLKPAPASTDKDLEDVDHFYNSAGGYFCIVECNGSPVATGGLLKISDSRCELRKMYLAKHARGKGIGKRTLAHLIDQARNYQFQDITLETAFVLKEAISLYQAFGFVETQELELSNRCDKAMILDIR